MREPRKVWLRKAIFQIHVWIGVGAGLYLAMACATGSAVVFRHELNTALLPPTIVAASGARLTADELRERARRACPGFEVTAMSIPWKADRAVTIRLRRGSQQRERLFDPYTGNDLGRSASFEVPLVVWLADLHDNLLLGQTGRALNGIGAGLLMLMCLSGAVIWWPGAARWRRGLTIRWAANWKRVTFDLHGAIGVWTLAPLTMWAVTAVYLVFPDPFERGVDLLQPPIPGSRDVRGGDLVLSWLARLHFGRSFGTTLGVLYAVVGLVPALLFITGCLMWWNRVRGSDYFGISSSIDGS
jgi:uncharacterized iron-regulated membrane protein